MADKAISDLTAATQVNSGDLFVLQQSGTAKKLTGQILENWLLSLADGHGGIQTLEKTSTSGLVDTYTITYADETTSTFTVTNGKAISSITIYYAVSNSDTTAPSSGWSTSYQQMTSTNRFLWSYEVIAFNNGTSITTTKVVIGVYGQKGDTGATGNGIASMSSGTHTPGEYTVYTFTYTDGSTDSFYSYDGVGVASITKTSTVGLVDTYTITYTNGATPTTFTVTNAKSITSVTKTGTSGLVDTYTVAFNDGTSTTFTVTNGATISTIAKTSTSGLVDTYTVTMSDGRTTTFTVTNAKSIVSVEQTSGTHAAGTTDVYTITFNDGDTTTFSVYNGANGTGAVSTVDGIQADGDQNVVLLLTGNSAPTSTTPGELYQRYFDLSTQILYICVGVDTSTNPTTYSWAGTGVPVDSSLSTMSENPVQNKVITAKVGTATLTTTATDLSGAVNELNSGKAPLASPALTGTPTAPTATAGTYTTQIATTAFANTAASNAVSTYVRPNLLDNWYFVGGGSQNGYGVFPINQRRQTSYNTNATYGLDRWITDGSNSVSLTNDGILITTPASTATNSFAFFQKLPSFSRGVKYTVSVLVTSISGSYNVVFGSRGTSANRIAVSTFNTTGLHTVTGSIDADVTDPFVCFRRSGTGTQTTITISAIKVELGDTQTLAHQENGAWVLNEIPDYQAEFNKCAAYLFVPYNRVEAREAYHTTNSIYYDVPIPVPMVGSVTITGSPTVYSLSDVSTAETGFTFSATYRIGSPILRITASKTSHGLSDTIIVYGNSSGGSPVCIYSAEP